MSFSVTQLKLKFWCNVYVLHSLLVLSYSLYCSCNIVTIWSRTYSLPSQVLECSSVQWHPQAPYPQQELLGVEEQLQDSVELILQEDLALE